MDGPRQANRGDAPAVILRRRDQWVLTVLLTMGFVAMGGLWWAAGGWRNGLVHLDRAERRNAEFRVDINQAEWPELALLPGVGETLARRIVDHRRRHGPFESMADLDDVHGIGPAKLARIAPWVVTPSDPQRDSAGHPGDDRARDPGDDRARDPGDRRP